MKVTTLTILIALLALGCAPSFQVTETTDRFEPDNRRLSSSEIKIKTPRGQKNDLGLRLDYYESPETPDGFFAMTISHYGDLWVLPDEIKILVDGVVTSLRPRQPSHQEVEIRRVSEHMTVQVPELLLKSMISASTLEFRLKAPDQQIDRVIKPEAQAHIRDFYIEARGRS